MQYNMDLLITEMENLLASGKEDYAIQDIIGEYDGINIDDLLIEADKIINETLPFFQKISNVNKVVTSKDVKSTKIQVDTKRVVFNLKNDYQCITIPKKFPKIGNLTTINRCKIDKEIQNNMSHLNPKKCISREFKIPEVNLMKTPLQVGSTKLENNNRLHIMSNNQEQLINNIEKCDQVIKLQMEEELNYYKLKNDELEKNLILKEHEIDILENRYQQLNEYCDLVLKIKIEEKFKKYDCKLNGLIQRNTTRESQLHTIINNLLEEINQSHSQYKIKLSENNKQINKYLDQIERILDSIYKFRNINNVK